MVINQRITESMAYGFVIQELLYLKKSFSGLIILDLMLLGEEVDKIIGLEVGTDDYLAKPFNPSTPSTLMKY